MVDEIPLTQTLDAIADEVERLGALFPHSHAIGNEVHAVRLLQRAFPRPSAAEIQMARECLNRINIAIVTSTHDSRVFPALSCNRMARFEEAMTSLILETIGVDLPPACRQAFVEELETEGCTAGMVFIGYVKDVPGLVYVLWHLAGRVPVTTVVPRNRFISANSSREVAHDFLAQWHQHIG